MKKLFKILGVTLLAVIILVVAAPFFFKDQIAQIIKDKLNASMDAQIDFADVDLSLFSAFPDARLNIEGVSIINKAPFAGDTLFYGREVKLDLPIGDLFNDASESIHVNELIVNGAVSRLTVDEEGNSSWDIAKEDTAAVTAQADTIEEGTGFSFDLKHYELTNTQLTYEDKSTQMKFAMSQMNHSGNGDFSLGQSTLDTYTEALVFYTMDGIDYLSGQQVKLDAEILMDLENQKYMFQENKAFINDLELKLNGFVELEDAYTMVDLSFDTPSSDFKNFFAVIPETYRKNLAGITTTGDFTVNGTIKGAVDDTRIPKMDIRISSNNASFKYPDLPKTVTNININAQLKNDTGNVDDTYFNVAQTSFHIGSDRISGSAMIKNLTTNMDVDINAQGNLNFQNLAQAFPLPDGMTLDGKLALDMAAKFDMKSIEKERYERITTKGTASLTDFKYVGDAMTKPLTINKAIVNMTTSRIKLEDFDAQTGNTDLKASGTINNLVGFLLQDQDLKGTFNVSSNTLDASDFMTATEVTPAQKATDKTQNSTSSTTKEAIKIPAFLDANLDFQANRVLYDGLDLKNVSGIALVRDETLTLNNVKTDIFDGNIGVNGSVSTKGDTPVFNMVLDMKNLDIAKSFEGFDMFKSFVPILKSLQGKINTDITLSGNLDNELSPILGTVVGDAFAQVLTKDINAANNPLLGKLDNKISFIDLEKFDLSDIATNVNFKDGAVQVSPFDFNIKDIKATASGNHSLTNEMDYTLALDVPAKYLGKEAAGLLSKLQAEDVEKIKVPIPVKFSGSFLSPKIDLNLDLAVKNLTNQIIEIQKTKLKDKGEDALNNAVNDIISGNNPLTGIKDVIKGNDTKASDSTKVTTPKDSTRTTQPVSTETKDKVKEAASGLINNLFGKKKTKTDTTKTK
ncbi:AsmA-like C-terminal region-containing protein [uncultured Nonlabens sp.]|uniref:AsmA-like C-terminal region-containing protein n=1 Tax=uncultured Nonlabens sp. TaxID=859306 RepID=UPI0026338969|nr:AsmA-like C-terminal region-containing protein [uncultured Nonlabens sp.]